MARRQAVAPSGRAAAAMRTLTDKHASLVAACHDLSRVGPGDSSVVAAASALFGASSATGVASAATGQDADDAAFWAELDAVCDARTRLGAALQTIRLRTRWAAPVILVAPTNDKAAQIAQDEVMESARGHPLVGGTTSVSDHVRAAYERISSSASGPFAVTAQRLRALHQCLLDLDAQLLCRNLGSLETAELFLAGWHLRELEASADAPRLRQRLRAALSRANEAALANAESGDELVMRLEASAAVANLTERGPILLDATAVVPASALVMDVSSAGKPLLHRKFTTMSDSELAHFVAQLRSAFVTHLAKRRSAIMLDIQAQRRILADLWAAALTALSPSGGPPRVSLLTAGAGSIIGLLDLLAPPTSQQSFVSAAVFDDVQLLDDACCTVNSLFFNSGSHDGSSDSASPSCSLTRTAVLCGAAPTPGSASTTLVSRFLCIDAHDQGAVATRIRQSRTLLQLPNLARFRHHETSRRPPPCADVAAAAACLQGVTSKLHPSLIVADSGAPYVANPSDACPGFAASCLLWHVGYKVSNVASSTAPPGWTAADAVVGRLLQADRAFLRRHDDGEGEESQRGGAVKTLLVAFVEEATGSLQSLFVSPATDLPTTLTSRHASPATAFVPPLGALAQLTPVTGRHVMSWLLFDSTQGFDVVVVVVTGEPAATSTPRMRSSAPPRDDGVLFQLASVAIRGLVVVASAADAAPSPTSGGAAPPPTVGPSRVGGTLGAFGSLVRQQLERRKDAAWFVDAVYQGAGKEAAKAPSATVPLRALPLRCPCHDRSRGALVWLRGVDEAADVLPREQFLALRHQDGDDATGARDFQPSALCLMQSTSCRFPCLLPFPGAACRQPGGQHRCLRTCHVGRTDVPGSNETMDKRAGQEADDKAHRCCTCPLWCVCPYSEASASSGAGGGARHAMVGRCCDGGGNRGCGFVDIVRLPCGDDVIAGFRDKVVVYERFPHFQEVPCGTEPQPCEMMVRRLCPLCQTPYEARCRGPPLERCTLCDEAWNSSIEATLQGGDAQRTGAATSTTGPHESIRTLFAQHCDRVSLKQVLLQKKAALEANRSGAAAAVPEYAAQQNRVKASEALRDSRIAERLIQSNLGKEAYQQQLQLAVAAVAQVNAAIDVFLVSVADILGRLHRGRRDI